MSKKDISLLQEKVEKMVEGENSRREALLSLIAEK